MLQQRELSCSSRPHPAGWDCATKGMEAISRYPNANQLFSTELIQLMSPTIFRDGEFRLFFFSREEPRLHVHVAHPEGEAKFWLTPTVHLTANLGLTAVQLRQAQAIIESHLAEITHAWKRHFGS